MTVPVWVQSWEFECCQPDVSVGQQWDATVVLRPPEPWWEHFASSPLSENVRHLGVAEVGIVTRPDGVLHVTMDEPAATRFRGRLVFDAHNVSDDEQQVVITGVVRRIRGVELTQAMRPGEVIVPVGQSEPVDVSATGPGTDEPVAREFTEFIIDVELLTAR